MKFLVNPLPYLKVVWVDLGKSIGYHPISKCWTYSQEPSSHARHDNEIHPCPFMLFMQTEYKMLGATSSLCSDKSNILSGDPESKCG